MAAARKKGQAPSPPSEEASFESAIQQLEGIVDQLEQGDLELEAAMAAFEQGVRLSKHCAVRLEAAQQRIEVLSQEGGEWTTRPFEPAEAEGDDAGEEIG
jgi:exodeoxyribonuclease VII small subunit